MPLGAAAAAAAGLISSEEVRARAELANRQNAAFEELGGAYSTRAYKDHLKQHGMRPPAALERVPTPSDDQVRGGRPLLRLWGRAAWAC